MWGYIKELEYRIIKYFLATIVGDMAQFLLLSLPQPQRGLVSPKIPLRYGITR